MSEKISLDERDQLHSQQWVKLYGVTTKHPGKYDYIVTCQIEQLEVVLHSIQISWWDNFLLEPVDEKEQPMSLEEAVKKKDESL